MFFVGLGVAAVVEVVVARVVIMGMFGGSRGRGSNDDVGSSADSGSGGWYGRHSGGCGGSCSSGVSSVRFLVVVEPMLVFVMFS